MAGRTRPFDASPQRYAHNRTGEDNAETHMKRQIMGREVVLAIIDGKLGFGPWEQIFYGECDGRRPERVLELDQLGLLGVDGSEFLKHFI